VLAYCVRVSFIALAIALSSPALAAENDWTIGDTIAQSTVTALFITDWKQTQYIAKHPKDPMLPNGTYQWRAESNPILGEYPSTGRINNYFAIVLSGKLHCARER